MSDDKLPPLHKVIAACKIGHKYLGPDTVDLAAAAWLERLSAAQTMLAKIGKNWSSGNDEQFGGRFVCVHGLTQQDADELIAAGTQAVEMTVQ